MASVQDIADEARADLHDTDAANLRWGDVEMLRHVNASVRAILEALPEANVVEEVISISDGDSRQTLPTDGTKFIRAWNVDLTADVSELIVAVEDTDAQTDGVMTSPDGIVWTQQSPVPDERWITVAFSDTLGLFAAGGSNNVVNNIMTSEDGVTWTARPVGSAGLDAFICRHIIWASGFGVFIAVGTSTTSGNIDMMWSDDGITWVLGGTQAFSINTAVAYSASLAKAITIDDAALVHNIFDTSDGKTWADTTSNLGAVVNPSDIIWAEGFSLFLLGLVDGDVYSSPDGEAWTIRDTGNLTGAVFMAYSPTLDLAVAVSAGSDADFLSTTDGLTWSSIPNAPFEGQFQDVCWSAGLNLFIAVASGGSANLAATSPDGINWTQRTTGFARDWQAVACGQVTTPVRGTSMTHVELDSMDSSFPEWTFLSAQAANLDYPAPPGGSQCDHFAHDPREPEIYHLFPASLTAFSIFLTYSKFPTVLTSLANDVYPLGFEYFDAAVALVKGRMLEKDGRHGSASDRRVDAYNDFLRALGQKGASEKVFDPSDHRPPGDDHG